MTITEKTIILIEMVDRIFAHNPHKTKIKLISDKETMIMFNAMSTNYYSENTEYKNPYLAKDMIGFCDNGIIISAEIIDKDNLDVYTIFKREDDIKELKVDENINLVGKTSFTNKMFSEMIDKCVADTSFKIWKR